VCSLHPTKTLKSIHTHTHTHTCLMAPFPGLPGWAGTRKVKPIRILLKQETVSGNGISWAICKSAPRSRQITTPAPHHSVFYRPDALPATQTTASKHWRQIALKAKAMKANQNTKVNKQPKTLKILTTCVTTYWLPFYISQIRNLVNQASSGKSQY